MLGTGAEYDVTRAHVVNAPCAELIADAISRREPKISDGESQTAVETENVLRLQVSVEDP